LLSEFKVTKIRICLIEWKKGEIRATSRFKCCFFATQNQENHMPIIAPSLLAADFTKLGEEIEMINRSEADWLHVDVMDGVFVPNISFGEPVMKPLKKICKKPFDVHLMVVDPDRYLQYFKDCGADILTVHYEACPHLHRTIGAIK